MSTSRGRGFEESQWEAIGAKPFAQGRAGRVSFRWYAPKLTSPSQVFVGKGGSRHIGVSTSFMSLPSEAPCVVPLHLQNGKAR
jgi:hypothetical protein